MGSADSTHHDNQVLSGRVRGRKWTPGLVIASISPGTMLY